MLPKQQLQYHSSLCAPDRSHNKPLGQLIGSYGDFSKNISALSRRILRVIVRGDELAVASTLASLHGGCSPKQQLLYNSWGSSKVAVGCFHRGSRSLHSVAEVMGLFDRSVPSLGRARYIRVVCVRAKA
eukprot:1265853-Amphidinium_carterae.1